MKAFQKVLFCLLIMFLFSGCAAAEKKNLYHFRSDEAKKTIENATVLAGHKYYYAGPSSQPDTIIAISESYTLRESVHWNLVQITEKQLQDWNRMIDNYYRIKEIYYGYTILAPDNSRVGIGYSKYDFNVIEYPAPSQVVIWPPEPNPAQRRWENVRERY